MPDPSILKRGASWKIRVVLLLPNHLRYFGGQNDIDRGLCTYVGVMKLSNFGAFGPYFLVFFSRIMVALIRRAKGALFEYQRGRTWGNFNLKGGVGEAHVMPPQTLTNHQFPPCLLLFANICEFTIKYVHTYVNIFYDWIRNANRSQSTVGTTTANRTKKNLFTFMIRVFSRLQFLMDQPQLATRRCNPLVLYQVVSWRMVW